MSQTFDLTEALEQIKVGAKIDGKKEILGLYLSENEGANFWLQVLTDLNKSILFKKS